METNIALDCPYCGEPIYESIGWFKKTYATCPHCDKGLAAGQFAAVITDLEQAMAESIEEMVHGQTEGSCCGKKKSCGEGCGA